MYPGVGRSIRPVTRLRILVVTVIVALVVAACGGSESAPTTSTTTTSTTTTTTPETTTTLPEIPLDLVPGNYDQFRVQPTACGAVAPEPLTPMEFDAPADMGLDPSTAIRATLSTSCGDLEVELDPGIAPETVNSFVFLSIESYFDGTVFHRVIPGFVAQGGDQTATGTGGPGYSIPDEFPPPGVGYERGTIAMANAGPGTTGSQFFIMVEDSGLPPQFTIFGRVVDGFDVLDRLQEVPLGISPTSPDPVASTPLETIYVNTVTIER
jgi:cyclophilin family peptidyl-prolyl cis-trans isomerase